jgi:ribosomal protein S12 methylthiotransferase
MKRALKVGILSLGCPRNLTDSEAILGQLRAKGCSVVDITKAEIGIVNTCSFIEDAKTESIEAILDLVDLKKEGRLKKIIVAGCLAQRYGDTLRKELPEVDAFVGKIALGPGRSKRFAITPGHYAYVKICEGCVNSCSFCIIPKIKGRFVSLGLEHVLEKARQLDAEGISELNVIGQDICGWGLDLYKSRRLPVLLQKLAAGIRHARWIRLLYLYPHPVIKDVLDVIKDEPKFCRYIDLPVQHINNRILRLMNRRTSKADILRLIEAVRKKIPEAAIRTSVIVGFPSETDREFRELLAFVRDARFERLGAFMYSREEGTKAYQFKQQVSDTCKAERFNMLMAEQQKISRKLNARWLGKELEVLIDEVQPDAYLARSQYDAPEVDGNIYVQSKKKLKPGEFVKVRITDTLEYDLVGKAC